MTNPHLVSDPVIDPVIDPGLANTVVAATELSLVDGVQGQLVLRGLSLSRLTEDRALRFGSLCGLLWTGTLADRSIELGAGRRWAWGELRGRLAPLSTNNGMDAIKCALSAIANLEHEDVVVTGSRLVGLVAVASAAWARARIGESAIEPDSDADHAVDLLRMLGLGTDPVLADGLDRYLSTVSDHGMNASTFTARVIASTGADAASAVVGAVCALKGPLHGGAPGPVLDMLDAIGEPEDARAWLVAELAADRRIMGMGHRVYRVRDPRAHVLEGAIERLERAKLASDRLRLARAVEREAESILAERYPQRPLRANVEFYTAVLLDALGLNRAQFSPTFACGRVAGWWAHIVEQRAQGRLIRPKAAYVGPNP